MENSKNCFLKAKDIMEIMKISKSKAYQIVKELNRELEKKGFVVLRGRVPRRYFEERTGCQCTF